MTWHGTSIDIYLDPFKIVHRYGFAHIGRVGSVFMTLSVTLERFFAIVYPLKRLRLKTILIAVSTFVSVVYNIPRFLEFETILQVDTNSTNNESVRPTTKISTLIHYRRDKDLP